MGSIASALLVALACSADPSPSVVVQPPATHLPVEAVPMDYGENVLCPSCQQERGLFESDRAFPNFIGPVSVPILSKDPRSLTEARLLFLHNDIPDDHLLQGGDFQIYALQARVALTERLTFIADKDGYTVLRPGVQALRGDGFLNVSAGLKYTLIRDVENQFLVTGGFMYEIPTGEAEVFQNHGSGLVTLFATAGKEIAECWHLLGNVAYQFPTNDRQNSSFVFAQAHLDRQLFGWLYPFVEANWFHWTEGGERGLPPALGEGDGLINFGTSGVAGNDRVTLALGLKARLCDHAEVGAAWEFPVSNRKDYLDNRVTAELILRY